MIAKRQPYSYHIPKMDSSGFIEYEVRSGICMMLPAWEWVRKHNGLTLAGYNGNVYEISDLL